MSVSETSLDIRDASAPTTGYRYYYNGGKLSMDLLLSVVRSAIRTSRLGRRRARCHGHLYDRVVCGLLDQLPVARPAPITREYNEHLAEALAKYPGRF